MVSYRIPADQTTSLLPEGQYTAKVISVEKTVSSKGNDMFVFKFNVQGLSLWHYCLSVPGKRWMLRKTLTAITGTEFRNDQEVVFDPDELFGKQCNVLVKHEEYKGQIKEKIKDIIMPNLKKEEVKETQFNDLVNQVNECPF